jgi:hypothetical protein
VWLLRPLPLLRQRRFILVVEHLSFLVALTSGCLLMWRHGWGLGSRRWLALKVGLIVSLLIPIESFHAYICHVFLPAARRIVGPSGPVQVARGLSLESIIGTIGLTLFALAVPLIFWLSLGRPF